MSMLSLSALLGIRPGMTVSVVNGPDGFLEQLAPLPPGVALVTSARTGLDITVYFSTKKTELVEKLPLLSSGMAVTGHVWICFPAAAEASSVPTEDFVRRAALELGLHDDKKVVINMGWVGLRLGWKPRAPRPEKPQIQA